MSASFVFLGMGAPRCMYGLSTDSNSRRGAPAQAAMKHGGQRPACPHADRGREPAPAHLRRWCSSLVPRGEKSPRTRRPAPRVSQVRPPYLCREKNLSLYTKATLEQKTKQGAESFFKKFSASFPGPGRWRFAPHGSSRLRPARSPQRKGPAGSGRQCAAPRTAADG